MLLNRGRQAKGGIPLGGCKSAIWVAMQTFMVHELIVAALLVLSFSSASASGGRNGALPQMTFYHRLSPQAKEIAEKSGADWGEFPAINTAEYHELLVHRDLVRHGRNLATVPRALSLSPGNLTVLNFDQLYYSLITVGTPGVPYFVALDTGSDLSWLPCECKACAPLSSPYYANLPLNVYAPSNSSTSNAVTCGSSDCSSSFSTCQNQNLPNSGQCQYEIPYGIVNTSTSGTIYQDNIHLLPNSGTLEDITTPIILGCGQTQTGALADGTSVPDGIIGLGRQSFSVPSVLAQSGLVGDSFSMCFSSIDGSGRLVFGDFGSSAVKSTPFIDSTASTYPHYNIGVTSISIGNDSTPVNEAVLFDTGSTTTSLTSQVYKAVIASFVGQMTNYQRTVFDQVFEACYLISGQQVYIPSVIFDLSGQATFEALNPLFPYFSQNNTLIGFCLGILDGGSSSIIGANFMRGYNLIFNRQAFTLGFEQSTCYTSDTSTGTSPIGAPVLAPISNNSPAPTSGTATPESVAVPPTVNDASPRAPQGSSAQGISVPLLSILLLGFLVNFLLY